MARFLALSASVFTDPLLWDKAEYCRLRAAVDLCGLASFAKRTFEEGDVRLTLGVRETRPLSVRWLMARWGWKSTATVLRFLNALETRGETLTKHRTTRIGNTYIVGPRLLALCGETPNETPHETIIKKEHHKLLKNTPPTGESRGGLSENGTAPRKRAAPIPLPDDWSPNEAHRADCEESGIDVDALLDDFRFFWRTTKGTKANWNLTFTKRIAAMRSTGKFRMNGNGKHVPTAQTSVPDDAVAAAIVARMQG